MTKAVPLKLRKDGAGSWRVVWHRTDGRAFREPFVQDSIKRIVCDAAQKRADTRGLRFETPLAELAEREGAAVAWPTAVVFHVSRCGSTLLSQMLAAVPDQIVISEAPIVDDILRLPVESDGAGQVDDVRPALLRGMVAAFVEATRGRGSAPKTYLKLDCWAVLDLPLFRQAFPGVPFVFLYRDPLEVLVSWQKRPGFTLVRGTVDLVHLGMEDAERNGLSAGEYAAAVLGSFFRAAERWGDEFTVVAYPMLVDFVLHHLPGGTFDEEQRRVMRQVTGQSAKQPKERFVDDTAGKQAAVTPVLREAFERWTADSYRSFLRQRGNGAAGGWAENE